MNSHERKGKTGGNKGNGGGSRRVGFTQCGVAAVYGARVEYTVAIKNIQVEKGSLFDYNSVTLMDGTHSQSMFDEESRVSLRDLPPQGGMTAPPAPAAELSE